MGTDAAPGDQPRPDRRWIRVGSLLFALAALFLSGAAFLASSRGIDVDINSGRETRTLTIGPVTLGSDEYDTAFSRLVANAGWQAPPPEWRRAFTEWSPSGARINHRYGGIVTAARELAMTLEAPDGFVAPDDRHRLAAAAIRCLQRGEKFLVQVDAAAHTIRLVREDLTVLESTRVTDQ